MPLRRLNPKRLPGEVLSDYTGPKLEDFSSEPKEEGIPAGKGLEAGPFRLRESNLIMKNNGRGLIDSFAVYMYSMGGAGGIPLAIKREGKWVGYMPPHNPITDEEEIRKYDEVASTIQAKDYQKITTYHYTKPEYRLDQEMKKRGFTKFKGYNIADFMYERKTGWGREIHQKAWISKKPEMTPAGQPTHWQAYWSENPQSSGGLRLKRTLDLAIDDLLEEIDKWSATNRYPVP